MKNHIRNIAYALNQLLANYHIYTQNLKSFHWNVKGENFFELHEKFEAMYKRTIAVTDTMAERILILSFKPYSTYSQYLDVAELDEKIDLFSDRKMVQSVLESQEYLKEKTIEIISMARGEKDYGTALFLEQTLLDMEKETWVLSTWMERSVQAHRKSKKMSYAS